METKFRKSPPICLFISIGRLIRGQLKLPKLYLENTLKMDDGQEYTIFRHITAHPLRETEAATTFIVRFKFARLSHNANRIASIIPMLLITGFPGFQTKIYTVNKKNGYWQGMYQWKTQKHLEDYLNSFVYKMMNKRAIQETIKSFQSENKSLDAFIKEKVKNK